MRLGAFIQGEMERIIVEWVAFAATLLPAAAHLDGEALRDHCRAMLDAIVLDLAQEQSDEEQAVKSKGEAPVPEEASRTAAQTHATLRARDGFNINQMMAEYRALRATVVRLWMLHLEAGTPSAPGGAEMQNIIRFNEAIDQALTESVGEFSRAVEHRRNLLLGMLGHDIRNPLAVVVATAYHLARLDAGPEVAAAAGRLGKSSLRIKALLNDLADFSRAQLGVGLTIAAATVDLADVFRDEVEIQRAAHPGREVRLETTGAVVGVWDGSRLHQVLGNLVGNALKYGDPDSPVEVRLDGGEQGLAFSVSNRGPAIPASLLGTIFEPMARGVGDDARSDRSDSSLGLGLYIVREIVDAHEGRIAVQSDDAVTTFTVHLPA